MPTEAELQDELMDLSQRVERLRVAFQQYFMGNEKIVPVFQREQLEKRFRSTPLNDAKRTILKFRYLSLVQRYRTLCAYWDRLLREMETGRLRRLQRDAEADENAPIEQERGPEEESKKTRVVIGESRGSVDERLYSEYMEACERVAGKRPNIDLQTFRRALETQRTRAKARYGDKELEFLVATKGDRVVVKVRPKSP